MVVNDVGLVYGSKGKNGVYDGVLGLIQSRVSVCCLYDGKIMLSTFMLSSFFKLSDASRHRGPTSRFITFLPQKADIFAAPSIPSPDRIIDFDYHAQIASQGIRLLTRKPETFVDPWGFIKAFEPAVWFYLGITLLVFSASTTVLHWAALQLPHHRSSRKGRGVLAYIWFWFARMFPQREYSDCHAIREPEKKPRQPGLAISAN